MISNQILQNTLDGLKNISRSDFCVADTEGKILMKIGWNMYWLSAGVVKIRI